MSKIEYIEAYSTIDLDRSVSVLLTIWESLAHFHNDVVLVGGLAVHFHTKEVKSNLRPSNTLDVDLGISIAASSGTYDTLKINLQKHGFIEEKSRMTNVIGGVPVYIDF